MKAKELADTLGRKAIAQALDVCDTAVNNAVARGRFPASWFPVMRDLAPGECPEDLFTFRFPSQPGSPGSEAEGLACGETDCPPIGDNQAPGVAFDGGLTE